MATTIPGGVYADTNGNYHDAHGETVKMTRELRKRLQEMQIAREAEIATLVAPEPEPFEDTGEEEEVIPVVDDEG